MSKGCRVQTKEQRGLGGRQAGGWMEMNQISGIGSSAESLIPDP